VVAEEAGEGCGEGFAFFGASRLAGRLLALTLLMRGLVSLEGRGEEEGMEVAAYHCEEMSSGKYFWALRGLRNVKDDFDEMSLTVFCRGSGVADCVVCAVLVKCR